VGDKTTVPAGITFCGESGSITHGKLFLFPMHFDEIRLQLLPLDLKGIHPLNFLPSPLYGFLYS
jgi:hypothetical protein